MTMALCLGQAWAIAGSRRAFRYALVWAAVFGLTVWLGLPVLGVRWVDLGKLPAPLGRGIFIVSGTVSCVWLGIGAAWIRWLKLETASFRERVLVLAQTHLAGVLVASAMAYVLLAMIWISQIH